MLSKGMEKINELMSTPALLGQTAKGADGKELTTEATLAMMQTMLKGAAGEGLVDTFSDAGDDDGDEDMDENFGKGGPGHEFQAMKMLCNSTVLSFIEAMKTSKGETFPVMKHIHAEVLQHINSEPMTDYYYKQITEWAASHPTLTKILDVQPKQTPAQDKERHEYIMSGKVTELAKFQAREIYKSMYDKDAKLVAEGKEPRNIKHLWDHIKQLYDYASNVKTLESGEMKGFGDLASSVLRSLQPSIPVDEQGRPLHQQVDIGKLFAGAFHQLTRPKNEKAINALCDQLDRPGGMATAMKMFRSFAPSSIADKVEQQFLQAKKEEEEAKKKGTS